MPSAMVMDKHAEQTLLEAVRSISGYVADGDTPTAAVIKTARDMSLEPTMLPLAVQAYNIGRVTYHRESAGDVLSKHASFPIARIEDVMAELYPERPTTPGEEKSAQAVSDVYFQKLSGERYLPLGQSVDPFAGVDIRKGIPKIEPPAEPARLKAAKSYLNALDQNTQVEEIRREYQHARDAWFSSLGKLGSYFKQASYNRLPFAEVEYNAIHFFGAPAQKALDYIYTTEAVREKRAAETGPPTVYKVVDRDEAPYSLVRNAIAAGETLLRSHAKYAQAKAAQEQALRSAADELRPKVAGVLGVAMSAANTAALLRRKAGPPGPTDIEQDMYDELSSPSHLQQLRAIQARAMLSDFLHNDDVISGYDPDEVSEAFNDISLLSPTSAIQPAIMRPLLRKRLTQGAVEPFEAEQLANIEKVVRQTGTGPGVGTFDSGKSSPGKSFPMKSSSVSRVLRHNVLG